MDPWSHHQSWLTRTGSCRASIYICGSIHSPPRIWRLRSNPGFPSSMALPSIHRTTSYIQPRICPSAMNCYIYFNCTCLNPKDRLYSNITLVIFKSTLSQHSLDLQGCRASTDSILTPVRRRVIWLSASSQMLSDDGPCHLHTRKPLSPTWSTLPHQKETYNTEIHTAFLLQCFSKSVP